MNPRHRRLVIPVALAGLLVLVVVAAIFNEMSRTTPARPHPDARPPARPRRPGPGGRRPAARRAPSRGGSGSSCGTSTSRPAATCRSRRTTTPRRTPPTTRRRRTQARRDAVDDLLDEPFGNWHVETTTQTHQVRVTKQLEAVVHTTRPGRGRSRSTATTTATRSGCCPRTTRCWWRSASPTSERPDQAEPAGEVPPGRGVPAAARRRRSPTRSSAGHLRRPTTEDPLRIVDLGLRQRLPDLRRAAVPHRRCAGCRCTWSAST